MSEFEPEFDNFEDYENYEMLLNVSDGREIVANRYNTTLFTFFGKLATRSHVFIETDRDENNTLSGYYIFAHNNIYQALLERIAAYDYPMELNKTIVPDCDEAAFQRSIEQLTGEEVPDTIPDWFTE